MLKVKISVKHGIYEAIFEGQWFIKDFLKSLGLLAIPFDKGVGIFVMSKESYHQNLDEILSLPNLKKFKQNAKMKNILFLKTKRTQSTC